MLTQDLLALPLFHDFSPAQLTQLDPLIERNYYKADEMVFEQGDLAEYLYILVKGEVLVKYRAYDGPLITVAHIFPGGVFGWSATMGRIRYTSSAATISSSEILRISVKSIRGLCNQSPDTGVAFLDHLASTAAKRLDSTHLSVVKLLKKGVSAEGSSEEKERK